jgi:hypothetical protein
MGSSSDFVDYDRCLLYDDEQNLIFDHHGCHVFDIFRLISPNDLYLFKHKKKDMIVRGRSGERIRLVYYARIWIAGKTVVLMREGNN